VTQRKKPTKLVGESYHVFPKSQESSAKFKTFVGRVAKKKYNFEVAKTSI
jgi:hypothetical protein